MHPDFNLTLETFQLSGARSSVLGNGGSIDCCSGQSHHQLGTFLTPPPDMHACIDLQQQQQLLACRALWLKRACSRALYWLLPTGACIAIGKAADCLRLVSSCLPWMEAGLCVHSFLVSLRHGIHGCLGNNMLCSLDARPASTIWQHSISFFTACFKLHFGTSNLPPFAPADRIVRA